jgi:hypothetical protein
MLIDPSMLATDCNHMMERATDPDHKTLARLLRDFWLAIGNNHTMGIGDPHFDADLAAVKSMHDDLIEGDCGLIVESRPGSSSPGRL